MLTDENEIIAETLTLSEVTNILFDNPMTGEVNGAGCGLWEGAYLFPAVEKSDNYYVVFEYNGMTYSTVTPGLELRSSNANEVNRETFNKKFKNINNFGALQEDGHYISLEYEDLNGKSKLITEDNNENILDKYLMSAVAKNTEEDWKNTWKLENNGFLNVNFDSDALWLNCGLNTRYFDLALGLDVQQADVLINGKRTTYTYEQILTAQEMAEANGFDHESWPDNRPQSELPYLFLRLDKDGNLYKDSEGNNVEYNLYLYESDYHYRIDDYKNAIANKFNSDAANDAEKVKTYRNLFNELEVNVMYKAMVYNQSSEKGYATKLINYVPEYYELWGAQKEIQKDGKTYIINFVIEPINEQSPNRIIDLTKYSVYEKLEDGKEELIGKYKEVITTEGLKLVQEIFNDNGEKIAEEIIGETLEKSINEIDNLSQEITLNYKITKMENGNLQRGYLYNNVEIYEYYSEKGIVDYDSEPGNILETEDDIDKGLPLIVRLNDEERIITGTVFEDKDKDGVINGEDEAVNDAIVQLIEIKEIPGVGTCEYIWQETISGGAGNLKRLYFSAEQIEKDNIEGVKVENGIIERTLSEESRNIIRKLDLDNDGKLSAEEGKKYISEVANYIREDKIQEMDLNRDGCIDTSDGELLSLWLSPGPVYLEEGAYVFTGFIPGNYIIRFIYGDGTTYDLTQNQIDYNGQDYKSTYMKGTTDGEQNYMREWYNNTKYGDLNTKATDNPNRRLEVMNYSKVIDAAKGTALETLNKKYNELTDKEKENLKVYASIPQTEELTEEKYNEILKDVLQNTWMCAETAKINVPVASTTANNRFLGEYSEKNEHHTQVDYSNEESKKAKKTNETNIEFKDISFGLMERPKTSLELTKHLTGILVKDASGEIVKVYKDSTGEMKADVRDPKYGTVQHPIKATRDERGKIVYSLTPDIMLTLQNPTLELTYTYKVKNNSDPDYYKQRVIDGTLSGQIERNELSEFYYTENDETSTTGDIAVTMRVNEVQEVVNPDFYEPDHDVNANLYKYYNKDGQIKSLKEINDYDDDRVAIIKNSNVFSELESGEESNANEFEATIKTSIIDVDAILTGDQGKYDSYIAEIVEYSIPSGRKCEGAVPGNLSYVHSMDERITMETNNELDEFWGETFEITVDQGEDKKTPMQITIIILSAAAIVGVGIILIKKFVLKR